mmetsp:Transcript_30268/g.64414  ORF Transcript_30268/g.64414 Transcript_30268/m.64414 type:complete len:260 (-) Transcript_30268:58-837(-)
MRRCSMVLCATDVPWRCAQSRICNADGTSRCACELLRLSDRSFLVTRSPQRFPIRSPGSSIAGTRLCWSSLIHSSSTQVDMLDTLHCTCCLLRSVSCCSSHPTHVNGDLWQRSRLGVKAGSSLELDETLQRFASARQSRRLRNPGPNPFSRRNNAAAREHHLSKGLGCRPNFAWGSKRLTWPLTGTRPPRRHGAVEPQQQSAAQSSASSRTSKASPELGCSTAGVGAKATAKRKCAATSEASRRSKSKRQNIGQAQKPR